uniref:TerC family protein n=1 Tax=Roseihalotalea indica TaxID=2867963 RepID=A0AA49GRV3_9BACT|nr:TerC family protein [Tunicatimonas sp. TK19036]
MHNSNFILAQIASSSPDSTEHVSIGIWLGFIGLLIVLLLIDLKLVMRKPHQINTKEAAWYSVAWITLGVLFTGVIWLWHGGEAASQYITGYLIEKSLSIDNVFLWAMLFSYFAVPPKFQHRVLFWGIFGALVLRAAFIFGGIALLESIHWIVYVFGAILLFTAYRFYTHQEDQADVGNNAMLRWVRKFIPQTEDYRGEQFFVKEQGKLLATPLFIVLVTIELSDILFAVDSVPAILAVTRNEFLVFSSNAFAILGLRALYFLLADMQGRFPYLNRGLAIILGFVGIKFIISGWYEIPTAASLAVIAIVMTATILLSLRATRKQSKHIA